MTEPDLTVPGLSGEEGTLEVEEKSTGEKALEATPFVGSFMKAMEAAGNVGDPGGVTALASEGSALISSFSEAAQIATDPIGWLVNQGLSFLMSICEPLEDAIHFVSGDGPALQQAGENFGKLAEGLTKLKEGFTSDLSSSVQSWGGQTADAAATKLGEFASGIDGVIGQAGELSELLLMSSMIMQVIEDLLKAILTELIIWLVMIWIPALAAAVPSFGSSTAAAGAVTAVRAATTVSRVSRIVARLKAFLGKILQFLRNLVTRTKNLGAGMKKAMADKKANVAEADRRRALPENKGLLKSWADKKDGSRGIVGERMNQGFWKSMGEAVGLEAAAQVDPQNEKGLRNQSLREQAAAARETGTDYSKHQIKGYLDI
jgi:phage-related protein